MKEIRITFRDEDFTAVSRSLINLGVIFQVEPLGGGETTLVSDGRSERGSSTARANQIKKGPTKAGTATQGAGRLRAIVERNRAASGEREQESEGTSHSPSLPEDLSAKLLPYGERQES